MKPTGLRERVKKSTRALVVSAAIIAALSAYTVYFYNSKPLYVTKTTTYCTYQLMGAYDYEARLIPNLIYNKTLLLADEGYLYTAIVERLNVTFEHGFKSTPSASEYYEEVDYLIALEAPGRWTKFLNEEETERLFIVEEEPGFFISVDCVELMEFFKQVSSETGTGQSSYTLRIVPKIRARAVVNGRIIAEEFVPELSVTFETDENIGKYIKLDGVRRVEPKQVTETELILNPDVKNLRTYSYVFSSTALSSLFLVAILHIKYRERPVKVVGIEDLVKGHEDIIVRSQEDAKNVDNVINVEGLEEMEKLSEILMKPMILSNTEEGYLFYIIDGGQKYQYLLREEGQEPSP